MEEGAGRRRPRRRPGRSAAWNPETLEGRALLSGGPTIYTVNSVGNGSAGSGTSGTLPYVIGQANADANPAGSRIEFDPMVFSSPQTITLASTLELSETAGPAWIDGLGSGVVTISGGDDVRVLQVDGGVTAILSGLTISGGTAVGSGGGIANSGSLSLEDSTVSGNTAFGGSAAVGSGGGIANSGNLSITDSLLSGNTADGGFGGTGGGIANSGNLSLTGSQVIGDWAGGGLGGGSGGGLSNSGSVSITDSTFSGNTVGPGIASTGPMGGAIMNTGTVSISASSLSGNTAEGSVGSVGGGGRGGGIASDAGTVTMTDCTLNGNTAAGAMGFSAGDGGSGGGIANSASLSVTDCTFGGNLASGGDVNDSGGGIANSGTVSIVDSTFNNNSASDGIGGGSGGGLSNSGTASITGSTFVSNTAGGGQGGGYGGEGGSGGGIANSGNLSVTDSTFDDNSADNGAFPFSGPGSGGGIADSGSVSIVACTFSGNTAAAGNSPDGPIEGSGGGIAVSGTANAKGTAIDSVFQDTEGGNISVGSGAAFVSLGHNLFSDAPSLALDPTDLINTDPLLGPLADNGGPTATLALLPGSPAIDAGIAVAGVATDQRGIPRPQGAAPDLGAFESRGFTLTVEGGDDQTTPIGSPFPEPLVVSIASPYGEPVAGGRITFDAPTIGASASFDVDPATVGSNGLASVDAVANGLGGSDMVTAQAAGAPSVAFALTNDPPPTVMDVRPFYVPDQPTTIVLTFSDPMTAATAEDLANYRLVWAGRDHQLGTKDDRVIPIRRARYDAATESVTLRTVRPMSPDRTYWLTVNGTSPSALTCTSGELLDGAGTGRPGNDAVIHFGRKMLANPARVELIGNGDFEPVKVRLRDKARTIHPGKNGLAPWQITGGTVDVQTYWPAVRGKSSIDLNGVAAGTIRQTFATTPGQAYQLSFCYANNPDGPARMATAEVSVTGATPRLNWTISHAGSSPTEMNDTRFLATFVADSTMTTVQFTSTTPGAYGIVLDAVSVTPVDTTVPD